MEDLSTIRERIERAASYIEQEAVIMTTFNIDQDFLEGGALPIALGVEVNDQTPATIEAGTHQRLGSVQCTVFYDFTINTPFSTRYKYEPRPVALKGRIFHPKLIIMAGQSTDGTKWVYLVVSSANLTKSGWTRNAESFGETWIHTKKQQAWQALMDLLRWLDEHPQLGDSDNINAVSCVISMLDDMPTRNRFTDHGDQFWSGTLNANLYASVVHTQGLWKFMGTARRGSEMWAYSPYWGDVVAQLKKLGASSIKLVLARTRDGSHLSLSRECCAEILNDDELEKRVEVQRIDSEDEGDRFWHLKAYSLYRGSNIYIAVGSCNFTRAGLSGGGGNVEAMLIYKDPPTDWLPSGEPIDLDSEELAPDEQRSEDEVDGQASSSASVVVAYDWRTDTWRWELTPEHGQSDFVLMLPDKIHVQTEAGTHEVQARKAPGRESTFELAYAEQGERWSVKGPVIEINLESSSRVYGRQMSATDIIDSWIKGRMPVEREGDSDVDADGKGGSKDHEVLGNFEAVNLYELYRAVRDRRMSLSNANRVETRALLVGNANSVMALARLASEHAKAPDVRWLVLHELRVMMGEFGEELDQKHHDRICEMEKDARKLLHARLDDEAGRDAMEMLDWFEEQLATAGRNDL